MDWYVAITQLICFILSFVHIHSHKSFFAFCVVFQESSWIVWLFRHQTSWSVFGPAQNKEKVGIVPIATSYGSESSSISLVVIDNWVQTIWNYICDKIHLLCVIVPLHSLQNCIFQLPPVRFELTTPGLRDQCSTTELKGLFHTLGKVWMPVLEIWNSQHQSLLVIMRLQR